VTALAETIPAQPDLLAEMLETDLGDAGERLQEAERIWVVGTGSSQHAAELGTMMLREAGKEAEAWSSMSFCRFGPDPEQTDAAIVISHSGGTPFAKQARVKAFSAGAHVVAITGRGVGWDGAIETVDRERAETYTVSYLTVLMVLARLAGVDADRLAEVPERARAAVDYPGLQDVPSDLRVLAFAGSGPAAVTAREGALKVREGARLLAEGFETEYLLHGSAVPLRESDGLVLVDPDADPDGLLAGVGKAAEAIGMRTWTTSEPPGMHPVLAQIPLTIRLQSLASRLADEVGSDPDMVIVGAWRDDELWEIGEPRPTS
jgi:glutamine---fructose-6-phosphate transaminase (isomerizing)